MDDTKTLICPKCRGEMLSYERNGVLVDQCEDCRGIFLDRGELELLLDAERGYDGREEPAPRRSEERQGHDRDAAHWHEHDEGEHRSGSRRRTSPTSFLTDLLGGGD